MSPPTDAWFTGPRLERLAIALLAIGTNAPGIARSLSEEQCSKRYTSLVECKDANYSTTKSRLL